MQWSIKWFPCLFLNLSDLAERFYTGGMLKNGVSFPVAYLSWSLLIAQEQ